MVHSRHLSDAEVQEAVSKFEKDGFAVLENLYSPEDVELLRGEMWNLVDEMKTEEHTPSVFSTQDHNRHTRDEYFLNSSDKIRYFYEEDAVNSEGQLLVEKRRAFNKVGHGLHVKNSVFKSLTFSENFQNLIKKIGYQDPRVVQSMYIFKQPRIGGVVVPHYDATFLYVEPISHLLGVWIAVDDATEENGCLSFVPGSHKEVSDNDASYRFVRTEKTEGPLLAFRGDAPPFNSKPYFPVPVKKGSCVLIHGLVWHKSEPNTSDKSRHAYTFHVVEQKGTVWSPENWLQETPDYSFPSLYT